MIQILTIVVVAKQPYLDISLNNRSLFGNIELADLEALPSEEFEPLVDRALHEGTCCPGRGFVLMPSASPYGRHIAPRVLANYQLLVEKALAFR